MEDQTQYEGSMEFFQEAIDLLTKSRNRFMVGGAFAMFHYTGIFRNTKDLDIFCKSSDYPGILKLFESHGYRCELTDIRWLAKVFKDEMFIDIIFDSVSHICTIDEDWYDRASIGRFLNHQILFIPAEELVWCKLYVQNRERHDSADINHTWLKHGRNMDWRHLLYRMDQHWHLLLSQILCFQFVYPSDYHHIIPKWLFDELIDRANEQYELPVSVEKVCRGPMIDQTQYQVDVKEWNYKSYTIKTV